MGYPGYELDEYQAETAFTAATDRGRTMDLAVHGLGVAGEAGEVADIIKKQLGHGHDADPEKMKKELGDVLWYVARLADDYGLRLSEVARANIAKLKARYPEGFSHERSRERMEG